MSTNHLHHLFQVEVHKAAAFSEEKEEFNIENAERLLLSGSSIYTMYINVVLMHCIVTHENG